MRRAGPIILCVRAALLAHAPRLFARHCTPTDAELGELGEEIAARELSTRGLSILGRRVRTPFGEVDILARDGREIVAVEVKTSRCVHIPVPRSAKQLGANRFDRARWRVRGRLGAKQLARLERAVRFLARERGLGARVDLVEVSFDERTRRFAIEHRRALRAMRT